MQAAIIRVVFFVMRCLLYVALIVNVTFAVYVPVG
jgi:hypothetical protein